MAHCNTILSQILKLVPRHEFDTLAKHHHSGRRFRTASRWSQFASLTMAQLSGRNSLRDIVDNISAQAHRLYHLGNAKLSRSNLSRINEDKPYSLYEALFGKLLARCQTVAPGHNFRFNNLLYSLDASTIDLNVWGQSKNSFSMANMIFYSDPKHFTHHPIVLLQLNVVSPSVYKKLPHKIILLTA